MNLSIRWPLIAILAFAFCLVSTSLRADNGPSRLKFSFNTNWQFTKSDPAGAEQTSFDDSKWETVSAPHTFNDVDTFDNWSPSGHRGESEQWSGRTWYRKTFSLPEKWRGKKIFIEFEGVRQIAEVYLNGQKLGTAKSGFSPFGFDLTPHLTTNGTPNVLAVMVDNRFMKDPDPSGKPKPGQDRGDSLHDMLAKMENDMPEDIDDLQADQIPWNNPHWHPAHGGIYRNVYLRVTDLLHITLPLYSFLETEGPYAYTVDVSEKKARIAVEIPFRNERTHQENVTVSVEIRDGFEHTVFQTETTRNIATGESAKVALDGEIPDPLLWQPGYPHVYSVWCRLAIDGQVIDSTTIPLGIRTVRWDTQTGFHINGSHVKLHGWGQKPTNEWPGLGAALPDALHILTMSLMREAGANFVRWGHAAAGSANIVAGDQFGIITLQPGVDGEKDTEGAAWKLRAATFRDIIIYYRNNPSILIWEGGNQKVSREHAAELRGYMDQYDPHGGRVYAHRRADEITAEFMDIGIGTEGGREIARLPVVEGEYDREESPRRVWDNQSPPTYGYRAVPEKIQTYRLTSEEFAVNQIFQYVKKLGASDHAGGANWIFSDSTSGGRVETEVARTSGEVDGVRLPKEAYYVCQTMWRNDPSVHIIGHWTYPTGTRKAIHVVANHDADDVELLLNGKSLGHAKPENTFLFTFPNIAFEPGTLEARSSRSGVPIASHTLHTAGPAVALRLQSLSSFNMLPADGSSVLLVDVEAIDADGNRCPTWQNRVDFLVDGPAIWRGGYNSGIPGSINNTWLNLEAGVNRVALRATFQKDDIILRAKSHGLKDAELSIASVPVPTVYGGFSPVAEYGNRRIMNMHELAKNRPNWGLIPELATPQPPLVKNTTATETLAGRFARSFSYSGPTSAIVHLDTNAASGKNAYVDVESPFPELPSALRGADWIKTANGDALYHAVDLYEISVSQPATIIIAHDDRLSRPPWLTKQFKETPTKLVILGCTMTLFEHIANAPESMTLGANVESATAQDALAYLVFVNDLSSK